MIIVLNDLYTIIGYMFWMCIRELVIFAKKKKMAWEKKTSEEIRKRVFEALDQNINYTQKTVIGIPASYLDEKVFNQDASFLKDAPFLTSLLKNPNHIGCHTLGSSESFFAGTQAIERELIAWCAVDILKGKTAEDFDGYVASGGTEANLQAIWIYRNYFQKEKQLKSDEICIICSADNHYSMDKAANVLGVRVQKVAVDEFTREISSEAVKNAVSYQQEKGVKAFIVVANMMTTMFGAVDDVNIYTDLLDDLKVPYFVHVDGAYGGFYYPFANKENTLNFSHPKVSSVTLDAHKMAQAPYGTGIFVVRKGLITYANTKEASYVEGEDYTLIGSRSGANAIAVWMILANYGPYGWTEKVFVLQKRSAWMCEQLDALNFRYYRHPFSNIITIRAEHISTEIAKKYGLVPDNHLAPKWYKIVVMEHVTIERLKDLVRDWRF